MLSGGLCKTLVRLCSHFNFPTDGPVSFIYFKTLKEGCSTQEKEVEEDLAWDLKYVEIGKQFLICMSSR